MGCNTQIKYCLIGGSTSKLKSGGQPATSPSSGASSKWKLMRRHEGVSKKVLIACLLSRLSSRCWNASADTLNEGEGEEDQGTGVSFCRGAIALSTKLFLRLARSCEYPTTLENAECLSLANAKCGCELLAPHIRPRSCYASAMRRRMQHAPRKDISTLSDIVEDSQVLARARRAEIRIRPLREQGAHSRLEIIDPNHVALNHVAHLAFRRFPCAQTVVQMLHEDICCLVRRIARSRKRQMHATVSGARTCVAGSPRCTA